MKRLFALVAVCALGNPARGHYNMLLTDNPSVKRGETAVFLYQWGHPFEHQLFDAPSPKSLFVLGPDGKKTDRSSALKKLSVQEGNGNRIAAWRFDYKPEQRGDHVILLTTEPIWMEEEREYWQDTVKTVLHVQVQKGWDAVAEAEFDLVPLTRPYGLQRDMAFQAELVHRFAARGSRNAAAGVLVEIEHYNAAPPRSLPPDEQITRTVKTDRNGVATCTLTDAGWSCITAQREAGQLPHGGKDYPLRRRTTLWVFVDEKPVNSAK